MGNKGGDSNTRASDELALFTRDINRQTAGPRREYYNQLWHALRGNISNVPIAQTATENVKAGASKSVEATRGELARANLSGTPWGQKALAETRMGGDIAVSRVPMEILQQFLGQTPNAILGSPQATGALGQLAAAQTGAEGSMQAANQASRGAMVGGGMAMIGTIVAAYI